MQFRIALIALASSIAGASFVAAIGLIASAQLGAARTLSDQESSIPAVVGALSTFRDLGESDARYQLEILLHQMLPERTRALSEEPLWLLPDPYPSLTHSLLPDLMLERYFATGGSDLTEHQMVEDYFRERRTSYRRVRDTAVQEQARALSIALACEQLHWLVDPPTCASWSRGVALFDPRSPSFMRIPFRSEPEGAEQFSVSSPTDGLPVRYVGDAQFLNGVIWGRYEAPNGESGYLPHTSLARPPTLLARLFD